MRNIVFSSSVHLQSSCPTISSHPSHGLPARPRCLGLLHHSDSSQSEKVKNVSQGHRSDRKLSGKEHLLSCWAAQRSVTAGGGWYGWTSVYKSSSACFIVSQWWSWAPTDVSTLPCFAGFHHLSLFSVGVRFVIWSRWREFTEFAGCLSHPPASLCVRWCS